MTEAATWGRVDSDGTVYVRAGGGERPVGQWTDGDSEEAMAFFTRRFEGLAVEVDLLERRVRGGLLAPADATKSLAALRTTVLGAPAVGDLDALVRRLDELQPVLVAQREQRKAARAQRLEEAAAAKEKICAEAESIAERREWRSGSRRLQELVTQWQALPRLDRTLDDSLWRRFSTARTAYTRARKQHFADQDAKRAVAGVRKEQLLAEAEELVGSRDWARTTRTFRELMSQWKAAGPAPREVEADLWARFRAAQDAFFAARDADRLARDEDRRTNAEVKRTILSEAEALLPVKDPASARGALRGLRERWAAAGQVPRDQMRPLEARMSAVEEAVRAAEERRWVRSNPETQARAADGAAQLESALSSLRSRRDEAVAVGDQRGADDLEAAIAARESWLAPIRAYLDDP